jgi:predicted DNA-binding transcriptional regulator AlpA
MTITLPSLITKSDLCQRLVISHRCLENMVKSGDFPPPVRIGKCAYWSEVAVTSWREQLFAEQEQWGRSH